MSTALDRFLAAPLQELTIDGVPLRYRSFGQGPTLLFVHGWPLSGVTYRHLVDVLRADYRCIVPDLPGAGASPWSLAIKETTHGYTAALRALVDQLQLDELALIGHDSGGGVARLLAAELGHRVKCLVLQNTELPSHVPALLRAYKLAGALPNSPKLFATLNRQRWFRHSLLGFGSCFGDRSLIDGEFHTACVAPLRSGLGGHLQMLQHFDLTWTDALDAAHAKINAPIHLFWGDKDPFFPLAGARRMAATFRQPGEFEIVPGAKLFVHEEAPDALARFSRPLLARAFASAPSEVANLKHRPLQS